MAAFRRLVEPGCRRLFVPGLLVALACGCMGQIEPTSGNAGGDTSGGASEPSGWAAPACNPAEKAFAPARIWQLTDRQYVNVARDVLGIELVGPDAEITTAGGTAGVFIDADGAAIGLNTAQNYR